MSNLEYLITRPGILKLATIVFGIITFALSSYSYADSPYTEFYSNQTKVGESKSLPGTELELYSLSVTGAFLGLSIAYLLVHSFVYDICESQLNRRIDTAYHFAGSLLLFAGGCVQIYSAVEIQDFGCSMFETIMNGRIPKHITFFSNEVMCHHFGEKIVAGVFSILNAVVCCVTGVTVFTTKEL